VRECSGDVRACVPALAGMIRRNVPLSVLILRVKQRMDDEACRHIFGSLQHNSNLQRLHVKVERVYGDEAMVLLSHPASALWHLTIDVEEWSYGGKSSLARKLKTNTTLKELHIVHREPPASLDHRLWMELLGSHNYTLRTLREYSTVADEHQPGEAVVSLLRRNELICRALEDLHDYHVAPTALLPPVLGMVSDLPTLLYRFVRWGDVNALGDLVLSRSQQQQQRSGGADSRHGNPTKKRRSLPPGAARPRSPRNG
jgi:hypothetical protein